MAIEIPAWTSNEFQRSNKSWTLYAINQHLLHNETILFYLPYFFIIFNPATGQTFHPDTDIEWSDAKLLSWTDFAGPVDYKSTRMALIACSIICKPYFISDSMMLWVETVFSPTHSWKKRNDLDSFDLAHEQTHFNIAELYARELRKLIKEEIKMAQEGYTINILFKIDSGFKRLARECDDFQTLYDKQTNHSINKAA